MTLNLGPVIDLLQAHFWAAFLVFIRVGSMVAMAPAFGEQSVPPRVKLVMAFMFTLILFPTAPTPRVALELTMLAVFGLIMGEVLTGLFFGIFLRLFVMVLQIAGTIAAQSTSLSQIFGGSAGSDPQPAMGHVLTIGGIALATMFGLHIKLAQYFLMTYDMVPFGGVLSPNDVLDVGLAQISSAFSMSFALAAPFVIASLLYNVTLGVINRAMPQLMVSFVGAPAITAAGLILLMLSAPLILSYWLAAFDGFLLSPFEGAR